MNDFEAEGTEVSREFVIGLWISFWTVDDAEARITSRKPTNEMVRRLIHPRKRVI